MQIRSYDTASCPLRCLGAEINQYQTFNLPLLKFPASSSSPPMSPTTTPPQVENSYFNTQVPQNRPSLFSYPHNLYLRLSNPWVLHGWLGRNRNPRPAWYLTCTGNTLHLISIMNPEPQGTDSSTWFPTDFPGY